MLRCTASILLRECIRFPGYKPKKDSHLCQDMCWQQLRNDLQSAVFDEVTMEKCIFIDLPKIEDHQGHTMEDVIEPKKKVLYFYDSLGETTFQQRHMVQNWKNFLGRTLNENTNWRLEVPVH
ncbi:hypothetical protein DPMN_090463 [Dreissena polymorpha]|uniref:Uncharacterized protein n=1 Tax=Dreissena polymorpha TaxID=45954 RepID=A0A9D4QYC2_DREPO|nr:hypothetical protein DPMN_090463 [Dreissena polymorpha]